MSFNASSFNSPCKHPLGQAGENTLDTAEFVALLRKKSVELQVENGKILLNAPAGVLTTKLQNELRTRKPDLLEYLTLEGESQQDYAPLTYSQERLWLVERFSPGTVAYNVPQSWRVHEALDEGTLRNALQALAQRHPALRTRIEIRGGKPFQIVERQVEVPLKITDLSTLGDFAQRDEALSALLLREASLPIEVVEAPMFRFHLIRIGCSESVLAYKAHHIVVDQWSLDVLKRDLAALYRGAKKSEESSLPAIRTSYLDIARRERSESASQMFAMQLPYWRERLLEVPTLLEFPFAKARPPLQSDAGETISATIELSLLSNLRELASANQTSLYLVMLTVFSSLIYRYTGNKSFCVGTPVSRRKHRDEEDVIGLFVNMLPYRATIDPSNVFCRQLSLTCSSFLNDLEHSDVPFQMLVAELDVARSSSYSPIFQVAYSLNPKRNDPGVEVQKETFINHAKFDLSLQIAEQESVLDIYFEYRTDLFKRTDIVRLAQYFVRLTELVCVHPEVPLAELPLSTPDDIKAGCGGSNMEELSFDRTQTLVSMFLETATVLPNATAICSENEVWSYEKLRDRSYQFACAIKESAASTQPFIAVCLERTPELIASLLGILWSGAAYLPLDPAYPVERLAYMLKDSGAGILIAKEGPLAQALKALCPQIVTIDPSCLKAFETLKEGHDTPCVRPDSAAYLIYTSGSTGDPKGVVVEHRNAVALLMWARTYFSPAVIGGILASTSVCFDLSIFEIFLPLITGSTMILVDDVLALVRSPHANKVTLINTVPSAIHALIQAGLPENARTVCLAGELLSAELVDRLYAAGVHEVFDLYGPTETTTYSTVAHRIRGGEVNIGFPIANTRIYLVDESLQIVPWGAHGEILIAGDGVTRGYLNRTELTEQRYVRLNCLEGEGRLYRTGDIARQREDGSLVYLGRRDHQIKLRGHRIELGEIEAVLRKIPTVLEAVVLLDHTKDCLVAYVTQESASEIPASECISRLRETLPGYMVPSAVRRIEQFPRTVNGKIDRKALSARREDAEKSIEDPPRDLLEQWLAHIWADRLGRADVPRNAHFFEELGGNSLVAFEIFVDIERRIGVPLLLAVLFQAPTVALLANALRPYPWKLPVHIDMVRSGNASQVQYVLPGHGSPADCKTCATKPRVMLLKSISERQLDAAADEIAAFERQSSNLVLAADADSAPLTRILQRSLQQRGFKSVSLLQCEG